MEERIRQLQHEASPLECAPEQRRKWTEAVTSYAGDWLDRLPERKAFEEEGDGTGLLELPITEQGTGMDRLLELIDREVNRPGLNPASGGHMGYIPGGGLYASALGDFLAAVTNRYAGVFFSSPGAVRMENQCLRWLCDLIGYPEGAGGNLTSGGSVANLIALVAARDHAGLQAGDFPRAVIYTTRQVHHCALKAIRFAGLGECTVREVPMDARFRMRPDALRRQVADDRDEGLRPLMIFASAGTTDLGAVDPLEALAGVADDQGLWFHVDAAYGGAFLLTDYGREAMRGIASADSVIIDPHKGLFLPYGSGALLVRDSRTLYESQHMSASYMRDTLKKTDELSPADLSPELSRHFRGLRLWLPLQLLGTAPFRAALEEKLLLARWFHREIGGWQEMETGPEPQLSVSLFRWTPEGLDPDEANRRLVDRLHADGRVFLSSTRMEGSVWLRMAVLHYRTHHDTLRRTLEILQETTRALKEEMVAEL
ncbi:MAG: pyridoxal-dependent decarboxylase [Balneolaceae bacterium]|nr:pyridoxal-dependent decarboxylase [Balneolaceae bacterium]